MASVPACSGDKESPAPTNPPEPVESTVAPLRTAGQSPTAVLAADGNLGTFARIVATANESDAIDALAASTLFVPSESAFKELDTDRVEQLLRDPAAARQFVRAHVVDRKVGLADLINSPAPIPTLGSTELSAVASPVTTTPDGPAVGGSEFRVNGALVTSAEIPTDSGYVLVIDQVLEAGT